MIFASCHFNDKQEDKKSLIDLKIIQTINPQWISFYKIDINHFTFTSKEVAKFNNGNILGDFDKTFNQFHKNLLINSPNNENYIDLDSYSFELIKNERNEIVIEGKEVDQEVNWVNRNSKEIKRLFFAASAEIEDAKWIDNKSVILFGRDNANKCLFIEFINLSDHEVVTYSYNTATNDKLSYSKSIRLNGIKNK